MRTYYQRKSESKTLAIGITGHLSSLCGAMKRFERYGKQWNGFLSLKEQCARRIACIKNEQLKCFISGYLPPSLFKYVTKDIFDLRRDELLLSRAKPFRLCDECTMDSDEEAKVHCRCPDPEAAMIKLNKYLSKRTKEKNENNRRKFELIYKVPYDADYNWHYERPLFYFMYLSSRLLYNETVDYNDSDDEDSIVYQSHKSIDVQVSAEEKLLFVDVMRYFGGFHSEHEQPELILSTRCDIDR